MPTKKYKVNGKRVPGVTTIISTSLGWGKDGLMHWAWEQGVNGRDFREERDKAADAGTIAHSLAEADIKGDLLPGPREDDDPLLWERAKGAFEAYMSWKEMSRLQLVASELSLIHPTLRYGGTLDALAKFPNYPASLDIVDFKTSNHTHPDHLVQLAAYKELCEHGDLFECEWDGEISFRRIAGIHLLRFSRAGDFHHSYYASPRMEKPWRSFQMLRELYDLKKDIEAMV